MALQIGSFISARRRAIITWAILGVALLVSPFAMKATYVLNIFILWFIYGSLAICWDLVAGRLGQIFLGQATFFGIGSYTTALLTLAGISPFLGMIAGGFAAVLFALVISPIFRLRKMYFAIGTLALAEALRLIMLSWYGVTGGAQGLYFPIPKQFDIVPYYYLGLVVFFATSIAYKLYLGSRVGLALLAIKEDEEAGAVFGVDVFKYKLVTLIVSALFVGITGGFYAYYSSYIEPNNVFGIFWSVAPTFAVIIGGAGTYAGPLMGAAAYLTLSVVLDSVLNVGQINLMVSGVVLIALAILNPSGFDSLLKKLIDTIDTSLD